MGANMFKNIFKKNFLFLVISISFIFSSLHPAVVIFDLEGVLVKKSNVQAGWHIGLRNFFGLYNPFKIEKRLFDFLNLLEPRHPDTPGAKRNNMLLPQLMCDWMCGDKTTREIQQLINDGLTTYDSFFSTASEKKLITATTAFMFTPSLLSRVMHPIKDGVKLLKRCYRKKNKAGERQNTVIILSNFDPESFEMMYNTPKFRKISRYCDGMVISGHVHLMKPDPTIFELLFNTFSIDPIQELVVFIDDQLENIQTGIDLGLSTIHCTKCNHRPVKKELKRLGVI